MSWEPINPQKPDESELIGDEPFDVLSSAMDKVVGFYERDLKRKPSTNELVKTFEHVLAPRFSRTVMEGETTELVTVSFKIESISKRQKYQEGDFLKAVAANGKAVYGRVFEIGPFGPMIGVYDSLGLKSPSLESLKKLPLVVRITPIHHELLEKRAWTVIGNLPIEPSDKKHPSGPIAISGTNEQLNAANCFYGLPHQKRYNLEQWVNR
jgi:hypothetical protein